MYVYIHTYIYIYNYIIYIYILYVLQIGNIFMHNRCKFIVDLYYQKCELFIVNIL